MGTIVKWSGVIILTYAAYLIALGCGARIVAVQIGSFGLTLAGMIAIVVFIIGARVSVK